MSLLKKPPRRAVKQRRGLLRLLAGHEVRRLLRLLHWLLLLLLHRLLLHRLLLLLLHWLGQGGYVSSSRLGLLHWLLLLLHWLGQGGYVSSSRLGLLHRLLLHRLLLHGLLAQLLLHGLLAQLLPAAAAAAECAGCADTATAEVHALSVGAYDDREGVQTCRDPTVTGLVVFVTVQQDVDLLAAEDHRAVLHRVERLAGFVVHVRHKLRLSAHDAEARKHTAKLVRACSTDRH